VVILVGTGIGQGIRSAAWTHYRQAIAGDNKADKAMDSNN